MKNISVLINYLINIYKIVVFIYFKKHMFVRLHTINALIIIAYPMIKYAILKMTVVTDRMNLNVVSLTCI